MMVHGTCLVEGVVRTNRKQVEPEPLPKNKTSFFYFSLHPVLDSLEHCSSPLTSKEACT